jgi:hypothetical protein
MGGKSKIFYAVVYYNQCFTERYGCASYTTSSSQHKPVGDIMEKGVVGGDDLVVHLLDEAITHLESKRENINESVGFDVFDVLNRVIDYIKGHPGTNEEEDRRA